jgi:hypothetical protein
VLSVGWSFLATGLVPCSIPGGLVTVPGKLAHSGGLFLRLKVAGLSRLSGLVMPHGLSRRPELVRLTGLSSLLPLFRASFH